MVIVKKVRLLIKVKPPFLTQLSCEVYGTFSVKDCTTTISESSVPMERGRGKVEGYHRLCLRNFSHETQH